MDGVLRSNPATALCLPLPILWQLLQAAGVQGGVTDNGLKGQQSSPKKPHFIAYNVARVRGGVMGGGGGARSSFHALWGVPGQL